MQQLPNFYLIPLVFNEVGDTHTGSLSFAQVRLVVGHVRDSVWRIIAVGKNKRDGLLFTTLSVSPFKFTVGLLGSVVLFASHRISRATDKMVAIMAGNCFLYTAKS